MMGAPEADGSLDARPTRFRCTALISALALNAVLLVLLAVSWVDAAATRGSGAPAPLRRLSKAAELEGAPELLCKKIWSEAAVRERQTPRYPEFNAALTALPHTHETVVVHVGKTAGASLRRILDERGLRRKVDWLHVHPASFDHLNNTRLLVITVRDPADRVVSSFRWLSTVVKKDRHAAGLTGSSGMQRGFFNCFPTAEAFAMSLDDDTLCGQRARTALLDPEMYRGHLNKGLCFYLGGLLDELKYLTVHVVRSWRFETDSSRLLERLGQGPLRLGEAQHVHDNGGASPHNKLSPLAREKLERHLQHEYVALQSVLSLDKMLDAKDP